MKIWRQLLNEIEESEGKIRKYSKMRRDNFAGTMDDFDTSHQQTRICELHNALLFMEKVEEFSKKGKDD